MIEGDSGEYEFLTEAVELSKDVEGLLVEVGVRMGMGTKYIVDAACEHRPGSTVIGIDPYGSILYTGREPNGPCRLDYTNDMAKRCMAAMSAYVLDKNVQWMPMRMTDTEYFLLYPHGVELYELESVRCNKYAMVHLDGTHTVAALYNEITWFDKRMDSGATICVDDVTEDFVDIKPVQKLFKQLGWTEVKMGLKKGLWQKK